MYKNNLMDKIIKFDAIKSNLDGTSQTQSLECIVFHNTLLNMNDKYVRKGEQNGVKGCGNK